METKLHNRQMWERGKQKEMEALEGGERKRANQRARIFPLGCRPFHGDRVVLYSRTSPSHTVSLLAMNHMHMHMGLTCRSCDIELSNQRKQSQTHSRPRAGCCECELHEIYTVQCLRLSSQQYKVR
ncbi:Uncharacterized protein APZ42_017899 [Daphnia magna]|uniref:Uncharacterized protein n=1 Tax=Daphnia magna TaxID=35525 RepID=A0A164ZEJ8_9CRUS|nr:Uncharacterized protein APZ42_017899 [Daphnia magna]